MRLWHALLNQNIETVAERSEAKKNLGFVGGGAQTPKMWMFSSALMIENLENHAEKNWRFWRALLIQNIEKVARLKKI